MLTTITEQRGACLCFSDFVTRIWRRWMLRNSHLQIPTYEVNGTQHTVEVGNENEIHHSVKLVGYF